ncbi:protein-L-isoaspartate(D-aspartate) O-methyltransferase [Patescibacteria group bacterium]|nr:protein-L-isoaspartate(D-aspartate) O-methyltransferase [Patescibacteria group bacterium]
MQNLINQLISQGYLKSPEIIEAFRTVKRKDFISQELQGQETLNSPLPIGHGQTISQPLTVAFMFENLQPRKGQKILDVGSGSGWTTAMLANIVGKSGKVYAIERIKELNEFGQNNVAKYKFNNVEFYNFDGYQGLKKYAPFDRIIVSAAVKEVPNALKEQLVVNGRLVIPTANQDIRLVVKTDKNKYDEEIFPGFVFVPLIKD